MRKLLSVFLLSVAAAYSFAAGVSVGAASGANPNSATVQAGEMTVFTSLVDNGADNVHFQVLTSGGVAVYAGDDAPDANHSTSFTWFPLYDGTYTIAVTSYLNGLPLGTNTVSYVSVVRPDASGFITGGGWIQQSTGKDTFGFVAQVLGNGTIKGNLEFQQHNSVNVKSTVIDWVYAPDRTVGYFSGWAKVNGSGAYRFFVTVHDRGEPGTNDDIDLWVYDGTGAPVYHYQNWLMGGNIQIHSRN